MQLGRRCLSSTLRKFHAPTHPSFHLLLLRFHYTRTYTSYTCITLRESFIQTVGRLDHQLIGKNWVNFHREKREGVTMLYDMNSSYQFSWFDYCFIEFLVVRISRLPGACEVKDSISWICCSRCLSVLGEDF